MAARMVAHKTRKLIVPLVLGLVLPVGGLSHSGCKRDEPPPPMPSATSKPSAPLVLEIEDSGMVADNADAAADVKKARFASSSSMLACCQALQQNAASAPPPANTYMMTAAGACSAAVAQGKDSTSISSIVSSALKGVGMPAVCGPAAPPPRQGPTRGGGSSV